MINKLCETKQSEIQDKRTHNLNIKQYNSTMNQFGGLQPTPVIKKSQQDEPPLHQLEDFIENSISESENSVKNIKKKVNILKEFTKQSMG